MYISKIIKIAILPILSYFRATWSWVTDKKDFLFKFGLAYGVPTLIAYFSLSFSLKLLGGYYVIYWIVYLATKQKTVPVASLNLLNLTTAECEVIIQREYEAGKFQKVVAEMDIEKNEGTGDQGVMNDVLSEDHYSGKEVTYDNEDMVRFMEQEAVLIQSFSLDDNLVEETEEHADRYDGVLLYEFRRFEFPIEPIEGALIRANIHPDKVRDLAYQTRRYNQAFHDALEYLDKEIRILSAGIAGEKRVNDEFAMYEGMTWNNFSNIRFEINGMSVETDNILLSEHGVFSIEVKNFSSSGSYSIRITKDGQWQKISKHGDVSPMADVTLQLNRHIAMKQKLFFEEIKKTYGDQVEPMKIHPIIVIGNDNVMIENESTISVMRISQVYHYVVGFPKTVSKEHLKEIERIILANKLPPKQYPRLSYSSAIGIAYKVINDQKQYLDVHAPLMDRYLDECRKAIT